MTHSLCAVHALSLGCYTAVQAHTLTIYAYAMHAYLFACAARESLVAIVSFVRACSEGYPVCKALLISARAYRVMMASLFFSVFTGRLKSLQMHLCREFNRIFYSRHRGAAG